MPIDKTLFSKWTRRCSEYGDGNKDGSDNLRSISLIHEGTADLIRRWELKETFNIEAQVRDMIDEVEQHARGTGDHQRYKFYAFFGENTDSTRLFTCHYNFPTSEDGSTEGGLSEPATPKGQQAQLMRLLNDTFKSALGGHSTSQRVLTELIDKLQQIIATQEKELDKLRTENRTLRTADFHEKLTLRREAFWEAQKEKLVDTFAPLIPTAFNALTAGVFGGGIKALPGANTAIENEMSALFGSLKPEQFHQFMAALQPHQQAVAWRVGLHFKRQYDEMQARARNRGGGDGPPVAPPGVETPAPGGGEPAPGPGAPAP